MTDDEKYLFHKHTSTDNQTNNSNSSNSTSQTSSSSDHLLHDPISALDDKALEDLHQNLIDNVKDIIACGFDINKTFIFANTSYIGTLYPTILRIERCMTNSQVFNVFGIQHSDNIGRTQFPAIQAAPSFASSFPIVLGGPSNDNNNNNNNNNAKTTR